MANGICVFAEHYNGKLEPVVSELVTAAHQIQSVTGEKMTAVLLGNDCDAIIEQLSALDFDEIYAVRTDHDCTFEDDAAAQVLSQMVKQIDPSSVLVPATMTGRSLFSRVAAKLGCGLTADCTELLVGTKEDKTHYIKQNKPSYGENVFVTIVTREQFSPQMMTVRPGVYMPYSGQGTKQANVTFLDIPFPQSGVCVVEKIPAADNTDSILSAEIVVVGGRGTESEESFRLLKAFADKLGAAIGGTRPLVDTGFIPFEHQIGQTGYTIRPRICISLGVSGAIQHTEGIKDTKLLIAVNQDEEAPIFNIADYGIVGDLNEILKQYLAQ